MEYFPIYSSSAFILVIHTQSGRSFKQDTYHIFGENGQMPLSKKKKKIQHFFSLSQTNQGNASVITQLSKNRVSKRHYRVLKTSLQVWGDQTLKKKKKLAWNSSSWSSSSKTPLQGLKTSLYGFRIYIFSKFFYFQFV